MITASRCLPLSISSVCGKSQIRKREREVKQIYFISLCFESCNDRAAELTSTPSLVCLATAASYPEPCPVAKWGNWGTEKIKSQTVTFYNAHKLLR